MGLTTGIGNLAPSQTKSLYTNNYIDFTDSSFDQWGQQFLPDVYEKEVEIYGNRTISSFLKMVSAELPSSSDQIIWTEQGRLHTRYNRLYSAGEVTSLSGVSTKRTTSVSIATGVSAGDQIAFTLNGTTPEDGHAAVGDDRMVFKVGQTIMLAHAQSSGVSRGDTVKGIVTAVNDVAFLVRVYTAWADDSQRNTTANYTAVAYGSEFGKATGNFTDKLDPNYSTYSNSPIIMKEMYSISGSDASQIGWIEVTSENGANGYLWYVKAEHENRLRWEDYIEMSMIEGEEYGSTTAVQYPSDYRSDYAPTAVDGNIKGTEGLFAALNARANVWSNLTSDLGTGTPSAKLAHFDNILRELDKNGAIEENMLYVDRNLSLAFDNLLAAQSDFNNAGGGASWGVFNNSSDMALNLGFSGFRRGSYDFYKTDWKYLNDFSTRGGFADVQGVLIPAGTSTVYDQNLGKNIKRPFLHVRYRASETENRKNKSWITGSVGGAYTTDIDELKMHYLTERCLITQGANNFFLLTD